MKLTKKKEKKITKILKYTGLTLALIVLLGLFISLIWVIPLTIKENRIQRTVENSPLFNDNYTIWNVKIYDDKAIAYVCENCRWAWNKATSEYVFYLEKENNKWIVKEKKLIWSNE